MADKASSGISASENMYMQLNASELSAIIMKGSPNSNDRDAGFCSGSSEGGDDLSMDHSRLNPSSPTDDSEDSVDVKVMPIALIRNKRKSSEPSKVIFEREEFTGPLKKRIRYTSNADSAVVLTPPAMQTPPPANAYAHSHSQNHAIRTVTSPWDSSQRLPHELMPNPAQVFVRHPGVTTLHRLPLPHEAEDVQQEPLALVLKKSITHASRTEPSSKSSSPQKTNTRRFSTAVKQPLPQIKVECESKFSESALLLPPRPEAAPSVDSWNDESFASLQNIFGSSGSRPHQRNYKNMTRERRIEANARERTRVHTISAAYETLRKAVPSYSNSQKLSKLSVLRVACSYILTLSRMAGEDYSEDQSEPSIADCFEAVTATIQTEGKIRKKKDE